MSAQITESPPSKSVKILLSEIIDYAGLFPPAQVTMAEAVLNYSTYKNGIYGWMLGRFIVPAARLDEFYENAEEFISTDDRWQLSVIAGADIPDSIRLINQFNAVHHERVVCDMIEVKASDKSMIEDTVNALPEGITAYFEIALGEAFVDMVMTLAEKKQRAKIRTGGVVNDDFPASRDIVRFVRTCMAANVPFKATAGLHHPIRCFKPLTYEPDAPQGTMHGFLNMLVMTGFAREGRRPSLLEEVLEEESEEAIQITENGLRWRDDYLLSDAQLGAIRDKGMQSFGSCSFDEPVADLQELGVL